MAEGSDREGKKNQKKRFVPTAGRPWDGLSVRESSKWKHGLITVLAVFAALVVVFILGYAAWTADREIIIRILRLAESVILMTLSAYLGFRLGKDSKD